MITSILIDKEAYFSNISRTLKKIKSKIAEMNCTHMGSICVLKIDSELLLQYKIRDLKSGQFWHIRYEEESKVWVEVSIKSVPFISSYF